MRLPTLTMSPPMSDGSTLVEHDVLAERRLQRGLKVAREMLVRQRLAAGDSAATSPRCSAASLRKAASISGTANRRRLAPQRG